MPAHSNKIVAKTGSKVIAKAGKIGSENNLDIKMDDTNIPKHNTIDMYRNPAKCAWLKILKKPKRGSVSNVNPLKK